MSHASNDFIALNIAVLTVSDTRTLETDTSGQFLADSLQSEGHQLFERKILTDNPYEIRAQVAAWAANKDINVVLITGGTGFTERDSTPEAVECLFDQKVDGFGELFRQLSYAEIGTSTIQSRAVAGLSNRTFIVCMPGSTNACRTGWEKILKPQLDSRQGPCNFVAHLLQKPGCQTRG